MPTDEEQSFTQVLRVLRNRTGVDFLSYKPATITRRILHRMATLRITDLVEYVDYLQTHTAESEALEQDVLIPAEQQARIFERFYRVTGASQQEAAGLGLGLYLTAQIVNQQGGEIRVESIEGRGSTFSFTLPRR